MTIASKLIGSSFFWLSRAVSISSKQYRPTLANLVQVYGSIVTSSSIMFDWFDTISLSLSRGDCFHKEEARHLCRSTRQRLGHPLVILVIAGWPMSELLALLWMVQNEVRGSSLYVATF